MSSVAQEESYMKFKMCQYNQVTATWKVILKMSQKDYVLPLSVFNSPYSDDSGCQWPLFCTQHLHCIITTNFYSIC